MSKRSETPAANAPEDTGWSTKTRLILAAIGVVGFIALYLIAIYWLPRMWTNFITGITNESVTTSWLLGLVIGFAFALIPILVFLMGLRLRKSWKGIIGWLVVAVVIALPNIMTLGVRFGSGNAAKTAWTKLSNEAPGFTVASYIGIAIGVGVGLWVAWITYTRRKAKQQAERVAAQHAQATEQSVSAGGDTGHADAANESQTTSDASSGGAPDPSEHSSSEPTSGEHSSSEHSSSEQSSADETAGTDDASDQGATDGADGSPSDSWNPAADDT